MMRLVLSNVVEDAAALPVIISTRKHQFSLVDSEDASADLRFWWIETLGRDSRIMAAFVLATDAIPLLTLYQGREDYEAYRAKRS